MTNQEPGAPEPLTSEEERGLRAMIGDAEVAHVGASYVRRLLATLDRDRAPLSAGLRDALPQCYDPECPNEHTSIRVHSVRLR